MNKKIKTIDLFAGIGGIRLGFEQAFNEDIETVFASEWDKHARETYEANFRDGLEIAGDITKIREKDIPEFDVCLAGFPCQAFSIAGKRKGFDDTRGTLFFDVARICGYHKPKVIFCENVKGLLWHEKGKTYKIIKDTIEGMGYTIHDKVLNSKDFGVPQNRERIFVAAFRNDIDTSSFVFPEPTDSGKRIRDIMEKLPVDAKYYLNETLLESMKKYKAKKIKNGFTYEVRDYNGVASTVMCDNAGRTKNLLVDDRLKDLPPGKNAENIRKMTPREFARLQGFPDGFILPVSDSQLYKQFGNTVTVPVIKAVAENIRRVLCR